MLRNVLAYAERISKPKLEIASERLSASFNQNLTVIPYSQDWPELKFPNSLTFKILFPLDKKIEFLEFELKTAITEILRRNPSQTEINILFLENIISLARNTKLLLLEDFGDNNLSINIDHFIDPLSFVSELPNNQKIYDIIICDDKMPRLTGSDFIYTLNELRLSPN